MVPNRLRCLLAHRSLGMSAQCCLIWCRTRLQTLEECSTLTTRMRNDSISLTSSFGRLRCRQQEARKSSKDRRRSSRSSMSARARPATIRVQLQIKKIHLTREARTLLTLATTSVRRLVASTKSRLLIKMLPIDISWRKTTEKIIRTQFQIPIKLLTKILKKNYLWKIMMEWQIWTMLISLLDLRSKLSVKSSMMYLHSNIPLLERRCVKSGWVAQPLRWKRTAQTKVILQLWSASSQCWRNTRTNFAKEVPLFRSHRVSTVHRRHQQAELASAIWILATWRTRSTWVQLLVMLVESPHLAPISWPTNSTSVQAQQTSCHERERFKAPLILAAVRSKHREIIQMPTTAALFGTTCRSSSGPKTTTCARQECRTTNSGTSSITMWTSTWRTKERRPPLTNRTHSSLKIEMKRTKVHLFWEVTASSIVRLGKRPMAEVQMQSRSLRPMHKSKKEDQKDELQLMQLLKCR